MKFIPRTLLIASALVLTVPNFANARGFDHTIAAPVTTAVKLEIVFSEDMQHRANNLPKKLSDRNSGASRGTRSGFANNGYYGEKDLNLLSRYLEKKIIRSFEKRGISVSNDAPVTMVVTIEDAKNNRPTFKQLSVQPSLSFRSFGIGGADVSAELMSADGASLGNMTYSYFESHFDLRKTQFGSIWFDAERSFGFFASKAAKTLSRDNNKA